MTPESIAEYVVATFAGVDVQVASEDDGSPEAAWGDTFIFYNPDRVPGGRMFPFATIVTKDYDGFDEASRLNRPGAFRLNIGLSRATFEALFPDEPAALDYSKPGQLLPHPVYGQNQWVCVVNPSEAMFERLKPLLQEAYERAVRRWRAG